MTESTAPILFASDSAAATVALGRALGAILESGDVVALVGDLGAGKTQLTRGIARGLGADADAVASPTFVLVVEHPIRHVRPDRSNTPAVLVHIDAYRMEGLGDLESIGWSPDLTADAVTVIEWADRIVGELPPDHLRIDLEHDAADRRRITLQPVGGWGERASLLRRVVDDMATPGTCPSCGGASSKIGPDFPFCSDRCRMADLNKWFRGDYSLSRPIEADDELTD